jgi:tRNA(Ile)-lysidine synthase
MDAVAAPWPAAVAVSGGSDSLALMFLLRDWAKSRGLTPPIVLCVDHGVRPESHSEALKVVRWAKKAGLGGKVLTNLESRPRSDIEAACRAVRYRLMGDWAKRKGLGAICVAHTRDDQAETFLLRLARGSGVDGLAAMRAVAPYPAPEFSKLRLVRPLLGFGRQELRDYLVAEGQPWLEDPMNVDPRFARARIRSAWPQLELLGLTPNRLAEAAAHLGRARAALDAASQAILMRACKPRQEGVAVDPIALIGAPRELGLRALASILMVVARNPYRPRFERLQALFDSISEGELGSARTLHGCRIAPAPSKWAVFGKQTLLVQPEKTRQSAGKGRGRPQ